MDRMITLYIRLTTGIGTRLRGRDQRGSVTTEHVLWAVAVIAIVAIVVAAVSDYVGDQAKNIK